MDQASASPVASCAHNPAAPRTLPSWLPSEGQARTVVPSRDGSAPQSVPHSEPVHIVPRPSSPALCHSDAKGYLLPDYYSGATGIPGRFSEGLLLRRLQAGLKPRQAAVVKSDGSERCSERWDQSQRVRLREASASKPPMK